MLQWLFFSSSWIDFVPWVGAMLLWWWGGWMFLRWGFQWQSLRERAVLAWGTGMLLYVWLVNALSYVLPPGMRFLGAAILMGLLGALGAGSRILVEVKQWLVGIWNGRLFWLVTLFFVYLWFMVELGLLIFDEHKNISLISTIAAGNLPPVNMYNPEEKLVYHYAFQIFGASFVRLGGMFPWIAFDLAKAVTLTYGIMIVWQFTALYLTSWARRLVSTGIIVLAGGTRYLLLFLPGDIVSRLYPEITQHLTGTRFSGAPIPYPAAFLSGLKYPFVMGHAGPSNLSFITFFIIWYLGARRRDNQALPLMTALLAVWALAWEAVYALVVLGILGAWAWSWWQKRSTNLPMIFWRNATLLSIPVVLLQGGTLTEFALRGARGLWAFFESAGGGGDLSLSISRYAFTLRWPPAVLSAHLGPLPLFQPLSWPLIVAEAGIIILLLPWAWRWLRFSLAQKSLPATTNLRFYTWAAAVGVLVPVFVRYSSDRDISRLTAFSLLFFIVVLSLAVWFWLENQPRLAVWAVLLLFLSIVPGVVLGGLQLTATQTPRLANFISRYDAEIARQVWNRLPRDSRVFDPRGWPAIAVTARFTNYGRWLGYPSSTFQDLYDNPRLAAFRRAGFTHLYIPHEWWNMLEPHQQQDLSQSCVVVVAESHSPEPDRWGTLHFRRLLDIRQCPSFE